MTRLMRNAQVLIEQGMRQRVLLAFLIRFDHRFAANFGKFDGAAFAVPKITRSDLLPVDESHSKPIGKPWTEFFHQVERQG